MVIARVYVGFAVADRDEGDRRRAQRALGRGSSDRIPQAIGLGRPPTRKSSGRTAAEITIDGSRHDGEIRLNYAMWRPFCVAIDFMGAVDTSGASSRSHQTLRVF